MKSLKFYIALWGAKFSIVLLKLLRRNASSFPGKFALTIDSNFMEKISKPKTIIGVTGTNGKTTVCNMIEDVLRENNYDFIDNKYGSNINNGITTTLIYGASIFNKSKKDLAVLEIDERSAPKVFPYLKPTYLVCTNLFRDSLMRNAHTEFIADILTNNMHKDTKLIVNADDLISSNIAPNNERVLFSINRLESDTLECNNIVRDIRVCPKCNTKLEYEYVRYHHIGKAKCPNCDFKNFEAEFLVETIDIDNKNMLVKNNDKKEKYYLPNTNIINIYNVLAVITLLKQIGLSAQKINNGLKKLKIVETRFSEELYEGINIVTHLAKGMNPIACSRAFHYAKNTTGSKIAIVLVDDLHEDHKGTENIAWQYDTDYEFLNDESIKQVIIAGPRYLDSYVRMLLAGVPKEKIVYIKDEIEATSKANLEGINKVVILHDLYSIEETNNIKNKIKSMIEEIK